MSEIKKKSTITVQIGLDEDNVPAEIHWKADDGKNEMEPCKAMLLSLFDEDKLDTIKLDLWTKSMQVDEMDRFMFQTLRGLADTYFKATQNSDLANQFGNFVHYFGQSTGLLEKEE
ncbi:gliding motility protein GldC [Portibacter lacus]|uniref:Gliding motility protein GldC n=1 Tax=Portibacter lacus TaxID=1099794 RepID=A0AA37SMZ5_9BACT|nr:gliding motility protein GldC [Portibacter lacus]GLR16294.1 gliding motility protein GldC [Portibacter lacus]